MRVNFSPTSAAPGRIQTGQLQLQSDGDFEGIYQGLLLNYDAAREFRKARPLTALAPTQPTQAESEALKIFVRESGIYRVDYAMFQGAGIDPSQVDPRTIKLKIWGKQVPIYIRGEVDGKFDEEDYIEFFGAKADSIYTRWDVYRMTWGGVRGMRMAQKSGAPKAFTAREVTSFKSVERFEEDHLHHKLQNVHPDPGDPDAWFELRYQLVAMQNKQKLGDSLVSIEENLKKTLNYALIERLLRGEKYDEISQTD